MLVVNDGNDACLSSLAVLYSDALALEVNVAGIEGDELVASKPCPVERLYDTSVAEVGRGDGDLFDVRWF
jgi:hypothetical protein